MKEEKAWVERERQTDWRTQRRFSYFFFLPWQNPWRNMLLSSNQEEGQRPIILHMSFFFSLKELIVHKSYQSILSSSEVEDRSGRRESECMRERERERKWEKEREREKIEETDQTIPVTFTFIHGGGEREIIRHRQTDRDISYFFLLFRNPTDTNLTSPYYPLSGLKITMMRLLTEAVDRGAAHIRDPIGGSNENLFVWV